MAHNPLLGSRISLISKKNIRYEGTLYSINEADATVALQNVRSYGTEGREKLDPASTFVAPQDLIHPYLLFRGCDIKDLHVHENADQQQQQPQQQQQQQPQQQQQQQQQEQQQSQQQSQQPQQQQGQQQQSQPQAESQPQPSSALATTTTTTTATTTTATSTETATASASASTTAPPSQLASNLSPSLPNAQQQQQQNIEESSKTMEAAITTPVAPDKETEGAMKDVVNDTESNKERERTTESQGNGEDHRRGPNKGGPKGGATGGNRRQKKPDPAHQVGTGASLLNRKVRGTVDGGPVETPSDDFDFQSSLAQFSKETNENGNDQGDHPESHYDKDDFFDSISCDALDRQAGIDNRLRGAAERTLNTETFGAVALNSQRRRRRNRAGGRGRGRGAGRGGRGRGRGGRGGGRGRGSKENHRWRQDRNNNHERSHAQKAQS